jgi:hypothetical protein
MKHYKVVPWEPGGAHVVDRATGEEVGHVLADHLNNWEGIAPAPPEDGGHRVVGYFRLRSDAAQAVWDER